jgi:hypothetical protein
VDNPYQPPEASLESTVAADELVAYDTTLYEIAKLTSAARVVGLLSLLGGLFFSPVAIMLGRQAIRLIHRHGKGHEHEKTARHGIVLGYVGLSIALGGLILVFIMTLGMALFVKSPP